ncbi:hypothetical protein, partial [Paenibacillus xylanexedens]|uniref:hypothetical protein n=1 Tax=Paenibacillus xylanexedens TaxID=528191 RepID=UPI001C92D230
MDMLEGFEEVWWMNQGEWRDGRGGRKGGGGDKVGKYGDGGSGYYDGLKNDRSVPVGDEKTFGNVE